MGFSLKKLLSPIGPVADPLGLFRSGSTDVVADPYGDTRNKMTAWLNSQIGATGKSYTGETVAPMSEQEKKSLSSLDEYGKYDISKDQTFQNAKSEINKTLTNQYDPTTSPYYQAVKAGAERNLNIAKAQVASDAAGAGRYYSGARLKQQRELTTDTTNAMDQMLGKMSEDERVRRLGAVPVAQALSEYESKVPLQQAQAQQTLGALPRTIQQAQDQASLEDWLRANYEYPLAVAQIGANVQSPPVYQQKSGGLLSGIFNVG